MPLQITAIGTVEAFSTVAVTSEASGQLMKVHLTEGQFVKKGDRLFTIDPRPSQAGVAESLANQSRALGQQRQAEANLAKDTAQAKTAEVTAQRYETLFKEGVISREQYDQARTNADALAAVVKADQAAIASEQESVNAAKAATAASKVQLGYTDIRAPISGRTGALMIHQGNVIKANDTNPLVTINQVNPIYVTFSVPETQLPDIKRYQSQGELAVTATIPNDGGPPEQGTLSFINNAVDPATGTVKLKATFANNQQRLWPGQFVNVVLTLTTQSNVLVVPSEAIQTGQKGRYVFVVKPDQTVESRDVEVQRTAGEKALISGGVSEGETVVTDGQLRLRPGSKIRTANDGGKTAQSRENVPANGKAGE
ncbi:MAG: efflux RND transporter periplasmic adaptor subunit [Acidobacteria bacterium]|nr:efflux RND transporter periplasmic adaptor subunit [Acidobacteriota bacterium]